MTIERLIKERWFEKSNEEFDLPLTPQEIETIKSGKVALVEKEGKGYLVFLKTGFDLKNLQEDDIKVYNYPHPLPKKISIP